MGKTLPSTGAPTDNTGPFAAGLLNVDADGRLNFDLYCVECGHNLRGLLPTGKCGECGSLVELSMGSGPLAAAPVAWINHVRWGVAAMTLLLPWLWLPLVWPVAWLACWHMTQPDPTPGPRGEWMAVTLRILLVLVPVAVGLWLGLALIESWAWDVETHADACAGVAAVFLASALLAGVRLSARVEAKRIRRLLWLVGCFWALGLPTMALVVATGTTVASDPMLVLAGLLAMLALASTVVLFPLAFALLWREFDVAGAIAHGSGARVRVWAAWTPAATLPADASPGRPAEA